MPTPIISFLEEELPRSYTNFASGGETFATSIVGNRYGIHQRNVGRTTAVRKWTIQFAGQNLGAREALRTFFNTKFGQALGFRFFPPDDNTFNVAAFQPSLNSLGTGTGSQTAFPMYRTYQGPTTNVQRRICKVVDATKANLQVYFNGSASGLSHGAGFSVNVNTGILTFTSPPSNGVAITIGGAAEFDVPVCFDMDSFEANNQIAFTDWGGVGLVELLPANLGIT